MNTQEWLIFLKGFARALDAAEWPGNSGVSEAQLEAAERRLKVKLPPSYRAFLAVSNGWRQASRSVPVIRPVAEIQWFQKEHPEWVEAYVSAQQGEPPPIPEEDYFNYAAGDCVNFEMSHLSHTLCLSEVGDSAVLLLNPMVVWPDGEWEAWFFADWLPGASRYRCFADWMRYELTTLIDEPFQPSRKQGELPTVYVDPPTKAKRRIRPREKLHDLATLLEHLTSPKSRTRMKAAQQLARLGGNQAIDALLKTLKNDGDKQVRREAAKALGRIGAVELVEALIAAIDNDPGVRTAAIHALGGIDDERGAQRLLKLLEDGALCAASAVHPLAKRQDVRAIKPLMRMLTSKDPRDFHIGNIAGRLIAQFQEAGYLALEPLTTHEDIEIRRRALVGIGDLACLAKEKSVKLESRQLLKRLAEAETDAQLRKHIEVMIDVARGG